MTHDSVSGKFEYAGGSTLQYNVANGVLTIQGTEVPDLQRGKGIAACLVEEAVTYAKASRLKLRATCSYLARHPEHDSLIAAEINE